VCTCAAEITHHYVAAWRGDTVLLWCNTSQSADDVDWTAMPTHENRSYVYVNGGLDGRRGTEGRYSIETSSRNEHSLRIYKAHPRLDSGRYECASGGVPRFGYRLHVTGV